MLTELPEQIDPLKLAKKGETLTGCYDIAHLLRVHDRLSVRQGQVAFTWHFRLNTAYRAVIQGQLHSTLSMICQRCLQPMHYTVHSETALMVLRPGESEELLPVGFEPLILEQMPVSLLSLVEDELILALPIIAKHETCPANEYHLADDTEPVAETEPRPNPFAVLATLKKH